MKKSIEIYALVVCFFSLAWFAITFGVFLNQVVRVSFPQLTTTISPYNQATMTNNPPAAKGNAAVVLGKINEQMRAAWEANYKLAVEQERCDAIRNLLRELISLVISALIFIPHWRLARSERAS